MSERRRSRIHAKHCLVVMLVALLTYTQSGCSLFTMAGKMLFGDMKTPAAFRTATGNNLAKEGSKLIVVCSTPEVIKADFPSLEFDMLEQIARHLKSRHVLVINPDDVATWLDDHGGYLDDPRELADHFEVDFIVNVDLSQFSYLEENSSTLYRGRASGDVSVFEVIEEKEGSKRVQEIFLREYLSVYPEHHPISTEQMSDHVFRKKYVDFVSAQIAQLFYDHQIGDTVY